jgi:hypothetical protein
MTLHFDSERDGGEIVWHLLPGLGQHHDLGIAGPGPRETVGRIGLNLTKSLFVCKRHIVVADGRDYSR